MKGRTTEAKVFNDYLEAVRVRAHQKYNDLLMLKEEELHLNLSQNCHTKYCTRHYAKPLLAEAFFRMLFVLILSFQLVSVPRSLVCQYLD